MKILKGQHWAVIPSRANSQRFPGKALAMLGGRPLIDRAITTAYHAKGIEKIIVNTNDPEFNFYERVLKRVEIYKRSDEYACSDTRIDDTLIEMLNSLDEVPEFLHLIQLTSPFTTSNHVQKAIELLETHSEVDSVQLVTLIPNTLHAYSQRVIAKNGTIYFRFPEERRRYYNSQLKPNHYAFAGYVAFRIWSLMEWKTVWGIKSLPIIGEPECAIDIDTPEDLEYAEFIMRKEARHASSIEKTEKSHEYSFAQPQ